MYPRLLALLLVPACALAENWPAWRGPRGDGTSAERGLPARWSATENIRWKVALPEPGNSTPIVWGDRVFITQAVGTRRTVMAFDRRDGKLLWQEGPEWKEPEQTHKTNPYAAASPVTDGERVIAWFGSAGLWCWNLEGQPQWHVNLGRQDHIWGYGSSPILHGDLCIVTFGPGERSFLVAVDKRTGKEVWRRDVPPPPVLEGPGSSQKWTGTWATPVIAPGGATAELVVPLPGALYGFDPATGEERWRAAGLNPLVYANALVTPETIVAMGGFGGWSMGVPRGATGDATARRLWQEKKSSQRIGSGVVHEGRIYMVNEPGVVQCLEPATGKVLWQERVKVPGGRAATWSSLVLAGDLLYLPTQASDVVILKAGPQFEQVAVNSLGDGMNNSSLAVSDGELFLRTHRHLWCISTRK